MNTRQMLIALAVVAGIGSAVYYGILAPQRGHSVEPGPPELDVTATQVGTGSWVRYVINVKNVGDGDFRGTVILLNRIDLVGPVPPGRLTIPKQAPNLNSARLNQLTPDAGYQVAVVVPNRQLRTTTVLAPEGYADVAVVDAEGTQAAMVPVDHTTAIPVAVLSERTTAPTAVGQTRFDNFGLRVAEFKSARLVPSSAVQLSGYVTIVLDQFDSGALSQAQLYALRDYVGFGGTLVLAGGTAWRRTVLPLPSDLTPLRPNATGEASLAPLSQLAGRTESVTAPVATGTLAAGARAVVATPTGVPLVIEQTYGAGRVVELAFDPAADPVATSPLAAVAWVEAIGRGFDTQSGAPPGTTTVPGPEPLPVELLPALSDAPLPSLWLVGGTLFSYLLLVGPVNYLAFRRRRSNADLVWITTPLIAVMFTVSFYGLGTALRGGLRDDEVQVMRLGPHSAVSSVEYNRILFLRRGDHVIQLAPNSLAAPMTLDIYRYDAGACARCVIQLAGPRKGLEHVVPGPRPVVEEKGVVYGSVRFLATAQAVHEPIALQMHLSAVQGRIQGSVANIGDHVVRNLSLYTFDSDGYHATPLADVIAPHGSVQVDAAPKGIPPGAGPGTAVATGAARINATANSVGLLALSHSDQAVVVGFTDFLPMPVSVDGSQPPRSGQAAFVTPAALESADSLLSGFVQRRLAASSGDSKGGFNDVYDLETPPKLVGHPAFSYDPRQYSSVEIYDWESGRWDKGSFAVDARDSTRQVSTLTAGELSAGMVRVRAHEPRVSWGSPLQLEL